MYICLMQLNTLKMAILYLIQLIIVFIQAILYPLKPLKNSASQSLCQSQEKQANQ